MKLSPSLKLKFSYYITAKERFFYYKPKRLKLHSFFFPSFSERRGNKKETQFVIHIYSPKIEDKKVHKKVLSFLSILFIF